MGWIIITITVGAKRVGFEVCVGKQRLHTGTEFIPELPVDQEVASVLHLQHFNTEDE